MEFQLNIGQVCKTCNMSRAVKILEFKNEFEAIRLSDILTEENVPHLIRTYHDSAYDGLWQTQSNWGHIEAPEEFSDRIKQIYTEFSNNG
jgi:hypothetical protein